MTNVVVCLVGTRPECVKMAPVISALRARGDMEVRVVGTGQHRELTRQTLSIFGIELDIDLEVMRPDQSLAGLTARIFERLDPVLERERPRLVLAQGDTTSVMVAALASFYRAIPFGHVEAGLRTHSLRNPFPEELNRVIAGRVADLHFAPTAQARQNLLDEKIPDAIIHVTGNTVIDALLDVTSRNLVCDYPRTKGRKLVLVTAHRRENFGAPMQRICEALRRLHDRLPDAEFVYPVHPNPNVRKTVEPALSGLERFHLIDPVDYEAMAGLLKSAYIVLTDSGGIQEEAPALGKPVLVLREETERPEAIAAGVAQLVGTQTDHIVETVSGIYLDEASYGRMARGVSPYGDGKAAGRIATLCAGLLGQRRAGTKAGK
ncbi:MAG: UDP-N-acetylglucosamine 2-epimerase (non-hydrolyzing) [Hyphomicrobiaceae bacterium]